MKNMNALFVPLVAICILLPFTLRASAQMSGAALLSRLGYPPDAKLLIVHADDVGMSHSVDMASFEALEKGYVSSASIMVPCPWLNEAAGFARAHPQYDFGLHLTLTSEWENYRWRPLTGISARSLIDEQGYFPADSGEVGKKANLSEVAAELQAQLQNAREHGIRFSHLDNHMGALSQSAALFALYLRTARQAGVLNLMGPGEIKAYGSRMPAADLDVPMPLPIAPEPNSDPVEGFRRTFSKLEPGLYIITVHLGYDDAELRAIMQNDAGGARARQADFNMVSNPRFRDALKKNHIQLVSWREIARRFAANRPR